eukprot:TRINITY_DN417_c1_g1_i1.p1 TRINITY_DN417_c1_g1~~TRINITY_DN417_c1_g1_i1.p1  ORF type:complete len:974 (-),score=177.44 TRINITY_DN417_c1_g1_i1:1271-4192(-)
MGFLLKEALRCLCRDCGWSYAVFWKIARQNPSLLVWEAGHYELVRHSELPGVSRIGGTQMLPKDWDVLWNHPEGHFDQLKCQEEGGIDILVNKMMMPQVHVVGEGIVGRAAFVGNHQWIIQEAHLDRGPLSEIQAEVQHQFSAGIKTIAVIPVLPHGVIQLGSIQMIVENWGFVSQVKNLFVQLGSVPGALLSDITNNDLSKKMQAPVSLGIPVSADRSRNACSRVATFTPPVGNSDNQQFLISSASRLVNQPTCSLDRQLHNNRQVNVLLAPSVSNLTSTAPGAFFHPKVVSVVKPSLLLGGKSEDEVMRTQEIILNPDVQLNQHISQYTSNSGGNHPASVSRLGVPCHALTFMEQQILNSMGLQEPALSHVPTFLNNMKAPQLGSTGCTPSISESVGVPLHGGSESPSTCPPLEGIALQSVTGVVPMSEHLNHANSTCLLSKGSMPTHHRHAVFKHDGTTRQQRIQKDLLESLENQTANSDEPISYFGSMPSGSLEGCWVSSSKCCEGSQNLICEDNGVITPNCAYGESDKVSKENQSQSNLNKIFADTTFQPSPPGSDLFDVLGMDFKIQQLLDSRDDVLSHGADGNAGNLKPDVSIYLPQLDLPFRFDPMNEGISESGIFSEFGTDNLLDAVVSKIHTSGKQIIDDNVSCKTTLTKASSPSTHNKSCYSEMALPENIKGELFGHSQDLAKPDIVRSSSFKTSCSLNKTGKSSQTDSAYKSHISWLVEDGQNVKSDSISTALSKRTDVAGKSTRRRPRPGENPRPRPKDRQMIQDRVKELREIVPNGAKCSIDALLERTIKHMVFLQSVTKHGDKLKQTEESKIISEEGGLLLKDNFEGGKTLAFEVGSPCMVCPIIVEDLNQPRQMLIEMLCEERGFFLEIADIIRGLGLTILKGLMEARDNKVWACFTVEADRDVTRMNVFLSLMRLLEQTMKSSSSTMPKGFDSSKFGHNLYPPSSIPMTSLADVFQ